MRRVLTGIVIAGVLLGGCGCATMNNTGKGAVIGAAGGAAAGALVGRAAGNTLVGAIVGAAIGGTAGAFIGRYMDKQAEEMRRDLEGAKIERIGEAIKITFDSGLLFDVDRYELRPASRDNLAKLAVILNKYPDTNILIEGHTDSTGARDYNLTLSERRARSVSSALARLEVQSSRFNVMGYGPDQPVATNDTAEGRQQNRRVDLAIMANEKLKKIAKGEG
jgi:outer membrane protein OmpA-like peptidoglycan-associated protein